MRRTLVLTGLIVVFLAAVPGSGLGSATAARGMGWMPAGLADAIHARLGAGAIASSSAGRPQVGAAHFGFSVAVSADGTTALVGAVDAHRREGVAYIFRVSAEGTWASSSTPVATLAPPTTKRNQHFGFDLALSADGTTAAVSAPGLAGDSPGGAIYVFHVSAENAWASSSAPTATLTATDVPLLGFALALSPDGTTLLVGAPQLNAQKGGALVYHVASEDSWTSTSTPTAVLSDAAQGPDDAVVGFSVAISGDGTTALLGDPFNPSGGGAYLYHAATEDTWTTSTAPTAILTDTNSVKNDILGIGLALSGDGTVAFVGAPVVSGPGAGYVDVFHSSSEAAWVGASTPTAKLAGPTGAASHEFGFDIAVSSDGATALVEAPASHAGAHAPFMSFIFRVADEASWASTPTPTATLTGSRGRDGTGYDLPRDGAALSADGATALSGAPGFRFGTGAADVFHASDASSWPAKSKPSATLTDSALFDCVVPRLVGLRLSAAKGALKKRSCRLGKVTRVVQEKGKHGHVVEQSRLPWARLPAGTKIAVHVKK